MINLVKERKPEILILYVGALSRHLVRILDQFKKIGEPVAVSSYRRLSFRVGENQKQAPKLRLGNLDLKDFKVIFFRSVGNCWEGVNLINLYLKQRIETGLVKLVDPLIQTGNRYPSMKAYQMFAFQSQGLPVPKTLFGSLRFLQKNAPGLYRFPFIVKRSEGGRGERVYLVKNKAELEKLVLELLPQEKEERKTFFAQEFIENRGDLRIFVLGNRALGAIKRIRVKKGEFRNNVSLGGRAENFKLTAELEKMALKSAKISEISVAGVDIILGDPGERPFLLEVNRAPQFKGFMRTTGINVPLEIARYLVGLKNQVINESIS
ncbi:MAG: hypothetical protein ABH867_02680 [Patescibacteria group bacterium]|nr:hypothetical protein [Patescibacteria group bacterium]